MSRAARWLSAERLVVFFLLLVPFAGAARFRIQDFDLWWHLAQGEWIVRTGAVPTVDVFSYTARGREWLSYSWLAEVLFHGVVTAVGVRGLVWLQAFFAAAIIGFVYLSCRAAGARLSVAAAVSTLAAFATAFAWFLRPLLFTLLFVAMLGWAVRDERRDATIRWLAPALLAVWANVHILFPAGLTILGYAALCRTIEGRPARNLWMATALASLATLANPYGAALWSHVLVMARQGAVAPEVVEFQSPGFHGVFGAMLAVFLFPSLAVLARSRERSTPFELGTFTGSLVLGLLMTRNMALFAILAAPVVARHLELLVPGSPPRRRTAPSRLRVAIHGALLLGGLVFGATCLPRSPRWLDHVEAERFPVAAVDWVAEHARGERILNDFNWGGYLIYRLFPDVSVSIDGRTQVYEHPMRAYMRMHYVRPGWRELLDATRPSVILWPADGPFSSLVRQLPEWKIAYEDDTAVVFVRAHGQRSDPKRLL
jgi:hypothetical protein